jgi:beta-propeller uncharacterized protein DUF5122
MFPSTRLHAGASSTFCAFYVLPNWVSTLFLCAFIISGSLIILGCSSSDNPPPPSSSNSPTTPGTSPGTGTGPFNQGSGFNGIVRSIVLAQDGSGDLYVGGEFTTYNGTMANRLIRLHPDGTVVQTFGQGFDGSVMALALAKTGGGELYVDGPFTRFDGQPVPTLIRLTRTGSLDAGFRLPAGFSPSFPIAPAEDGSGDLYAPFTMPNPNATSPDDFDLLNIARLNADGTVDPAFSTGNGFPTGSTRGSPQIISQLLPASNGKLYAGGSLYSYNGVSVSSLLRLNQDGTLDQTFMANVGYISAPAVEALAPAGDGTQDIYAGGRAIRSIRLHETGALDTAYVPAVSLLTFVIAPVQDGTADIYVCGSDSRTRLLRFNRNGAVVPTFQEPILDTDVFTIVPVQDGTRDFYIGGSITTYNGVAVNHIARVHADGSLASIVSGL